MDDELRDLEEIRGLKHRYCWYFDDADLDGLVDLFTDDAVCDLGPFGRWEGRDEIVAGYRAQMLASGVPGGRLHSVSNGLIDVDRNRATGRWYLVDYDISLGSVERIRILASYQDEYSRDNGRWRIARTAIRIRWAATSITAAADG